MGYLINGYKIMGQEALTWMNQNKATVGTGVSIAGTIVSNILSTRAGAKSARQIDAKQMELGRTLNIKEKVALCWKNHIIPGAAAGISCCGAAYSENQHVKNFNKVATAYGAVKRLYDSSKIATKEVLGEKKAAEYQHKMDQKYIEEHPEVKKKMSEPCVNPDPSTKQRYYEPVFGEVIFATRDQIAGILKAMNSEMKALPPRDKNIPGRNGVYGVRFCKFYE